MNPFTDHLRALHGRLDLPAPVRSRIILEVAGDMEDFHHACLDRGMAPDEARLRTIETFDLSDESLAELVDIHRSFFQRIVDRFSDRALARWEQALLLFVVVFVALFTGRAAMTEGFLREANRFVYHLLAVDAAAAVAAIAVAWRLLVRRESDRRRLRRGLAAIPLLGGAALAVSVYGTAWELCLALDRATAEMERSLVFFVDWLLGGSATLIAGHLSAIVAALVWLALESRARAIERADAAALLGATEPDEHANRHV